MIFRGQFGKNIVQSPRVIRGGQVYLESEIIVPVISHDSK